MAALVTVFFEPLAAFTAVCLKLYSGTAGFEATPAFYNWVRIIPPVITFLVIFLILLAAVPFSYKAAPGPSRTGVSRKKQGSCCCVRKERRKKRNPVIEQDYTVSAVGGDSLELGTLRLPDKRRIRFSDDEEDEQKVIVNKAAEKEEEEEEDGRSFVSDAFLFDEPTLGVEIARTLSVSPPKPPKPVRQRIQEFEKKKENSVKSDEENEDLRGGDEWRKFSDSASTQDKEIVDDEMYSLPPDQLAGRPWYMGPGPGASDTGSGISLEVDDHFSKPHPESHHYANITPKRLVSDIPQPLHNNNRDVSQSMQHLSSASLLQRSVQKNVSMRTSLQQNLSLRTTLSRSDYKTMNEFSDTMERLKTLLSEEDVRRIEMSMASIEQIIDPRETSSSAETDDVSTGHDVSSRELSEEDDVTPDPSLRLDPTAASMDNIISNLDNMIGDMDNWADDETDVVKLEITSM